MLVRSSGRTLVLQLIDINKEHNYCCYYTGTSCEHPKSPLGSKLSLMTILLHRTLAWVASISSARGSFVIIFLLFSWHQHRDSLPLVSSGFSMLCSFSCNYRASICRLCLLDASVAQKRPTSTSTPPRVDVEVGFFWGASTKCHSTVWSNTARMQSVKAKAQRTLDPRNYINLTFK